MTRASFLGCAALAAAMVGCGGVEPTGSTHGVTPPAPAPAAAIAKLVISQTELQLAATKTAPLGANVYDAAGNQLFGRTISWSTNAPGTVIVSPAGIVMGIAPGTGVITASSEGVTTSAVVTVIPAEAGPVLYVIPDAYFLNMIAGQTRKVVVTTYDPYGRTVIGRPVEWQSSNNSIATASEAGVVTAVGSGTASLTATVDGRFAQVTVQVMVPVSLVQVIPPAVGLTAGDKIQLTATLLDDSGTRLFNRVVVWSSANSAIAVVDGSGGVTALVPGKTTITATSEGKSTTIPVTVTP